MSSSPSVRRPASHPELRRFAALNLLALLALPLVACGKKGDPMPAPRTIPLAAHDLKVRQRGLEVVAEFGYPKSTVAGLPLPGLDQVTLYVLDRPVAATIAATPAPAAAATAAPAAASAPAPLTLVMPDPREFAVAAKPFLALSGGELASAISGDRVTVRFRLAEPLPADQPARIFSVRTHAAGGELSDWSNLAGLLPRAPAAPPVQFTAVAAKGGIELQWSPAAPANAGTPIAGYNVYRRDAARTSYGEPVATLDAAVTTTTDTGVTYGRRYIYALTAISSKVPLAESALSSEVEIDFQDRFAPAPPAELSALGSVGEVRLVWPASPEADVAGYVVERADPEADFHRVNTEPVAALELTDRGLASGFTFRYRVSAIDKAGNLGPPCEPVATRVP